MPARRDAATVGADERRRTARGVGAQCVRLVRAVATVVVGVAYVVVAHAAHWPQIKNGVDGQ